MLRFKFLTGITWFLLIAGTAGLSGCDSGAANEPAPGVPSLFAPANGSSNGPNAMELQWNTSESASYYQLQVSKDASFTDLLVDDAQVRSTSYPLKNLELNKSYHWRIRAVNDIGTSDWSSNWEFKPGQEAEIPPTPSLAFPGVAAVDLPTQIDFSWEPAAGATSYHIQVSLEPNFRRRSADIEGVRETKATVRELVPTYTYFWRVRSQNPLGQSEWSQARRLVVEDDDVEQREYK